MTSETPHVVVRTRRPESKPKQFHFTDEDVRRDVPVELLEYRMDACKAYRELDLPDTRQEAWRRTDLRHLDVEGFQISNGRQQDPIPPELLKPLANELHGGQLLLSPAGMEGFLLPELVDRGVVFEDLLAAERNHGDLLTRLVGKTLNASDEKFSAMAAAFANTGLLLYIPKGVHVTQPLHSILWMPGEGQAFFSHVIIWLEEGSSATFVYEISSPQTDSGQVLHAGIVEVHLGTGAQLQFVELQSLGENVWNFTHERARVGRDAHLDWFFGAIGGHLTKNFTDLDLVENGAVGKMSGFYFTEHDQHLDYDSQQNHLAPYTTSDLLFKGALIDNSRAVWQGMVYVAPGAVKADGYQANRNLLLSRKARADSIPGLEILADDVRCSHGATVSKVDENQVFYLKTRGIPKVEAEQLIVEGFFDQIMQRIPFAGVRERFQQAIHEKMNRYRS